MEAKEKYRLNRIQEITQLLATLTDPKDLRFEILGHEVDLFIDYGLLKAQRAQAREIVQMWIDFFEKEQTQVTTTASVKKMMTSLSKSLVFLESTKQKGECNGRTKA